jgi:hypothetical protein
MSSFDRRKFLAGGTALGATLLTAPQTLWAQKPADPAPPSEPADDAASKKLSSDVLKAVDRGLAYLARRQIISGRGKGSFGTGGHAGGVAVCGLGGLAFMCGGNPPGQGLYGKHVDRCVEFILANTGETGFINTPGGHDNMYGHGFATLFLAEAYGMMMYTEADSELGDKLKKAVKLIVTTQNDAGGWRYQPVKSDADLSITICQIMALRAARDAGIHVPDETRRKCIDYVKKSQNADGGFRYQVTGGGSTFPLSAAGVVALYSAGIYDGEQIDKGLAFIMRHIPGGPSGGGEHGYYFYAHYYAAQAMWHRGGTEWQKWWKAVRDRLLSKQAGDGSWPDNEVGPEFGTAMACIILQMPNNFLPIFTP